MSERAITPLDPARRASAAQMLAKAFQSDPVYVASQPDERRRERLLAWLMDRVLRYALAEGRVDAAPDQEGVACWLPPGHTALSPFGVLRSGLVAMPLRAGMAAYQLFDAYEQRAGALHRRCAPEPHWYLWVIGVEPARQGRGIGGDLLQPALARADREGWPCYLETGTERNARFYARHGFRVVERVALTRPGVTVWAMRREPVA